MHKNILNSFENIHSLAEAASLPSGYATGKTYRQDMSSFLFSFFQSTSLSHNF